MNSQKRKFIKLFFTFALFFFVFFNSNTIFAKSANESADSKNEVSICKELISNFIKEANQKNWNAVANSFSNYDKDTLTEYFNSNSQQDGMKQLISIKLLDCRLIDNNEIKDELLIEDYPILKTNSQIYSFIIQANCKVSEENEFFFNGINYFLVVLTRENSNFKIVQFNRPMSDSVKECYSDNNSKENEGITVLEKAEDGIAINANEEILTEGFENIVCTQAQAAKAKKADPPILNHYTCYSYPTSLNVKLNITGNNKVKKNVSISSYMKHTLPNEWIPSWKKQNLIAGAYCVKMIAIYRGLKPVNSAGINITQSQQMYCPDKPTYKSTNDAINSIKNKGMANHDGKLFFPLYKRGTKGALGVKHGGELKQYGAESLAKKGHNYEYILNYYYSNSAFSKGDIKIFSYNIGY